MILERIIEVSNPNIDLENKILKGVSVMRLDVNKSERYDFTPENLQEILDLGNSQDLVSYFGHRENISDADLLAYKMGYFRDFRIVDNGVFADLHILQTVEESPVLSKFDFSRYLISLAEHDSKGCAFSLSMYLGNDSFGNCKVFGLKSCDLVSEGDLTLAMFAKPEDVINKDMEDTNTNPEATPETPAYVDPSLESALSIFDKLDKAIKDKSADVPAIVEELKSALSALVSTEAQEPAETPETPEVSETVEPAPEAPAATPEAEPEATVETPVAPDSLAEVAQDLKSLVSLLNSYFLQAANFSKPEEVGGKVVNFALPDVVKVEAEETGFVQSTYDAMRSKGDYMGAAKYFKQFH